MQASVTELGADNCLTVALTPRRGLGRRAGVAREERDDSVDLVLSDNDALPSSDVARRQGRHPIRPLLRRRRQLHRTGAPRCSAPSPSEASSPCPFAPFTHFGIGFNGTDFSEEIDIDESPDEITYVSVAYATGASNLTTTCREYSSEGFTISPPQTRRGTR